MFFQGSIKVKNYKCFGAEEQGFERICPINIIIGRNNSGKSSLLDLIGYAIEQNKQFIDVGRDLMKSEVIIEDAIREEYILPVFSRSTAGGGLPGNSHYEFGMTLVGSLVRFKVFPDKREGVYWEKTIPEPSYANKLLSQFKMPFNGKKFLRVLPERDITTQVAQNSLSMAPNGEGATNLMRRVINDINLDPDLIRVTLLNKLNEIAKPDIEFVDILPRDNNGTWEIYFKSLDNKLIALSKMGSGIKTILIVLLNLLVIPEIDKTSKENYVFGFEELENNLHPSLQRRLYKYIAKYSVEFQSIFFITTHSNVAIDYFTASDKSQILHVTNSATISTVKTVMSHLDSKNILKDLDYRASDLLLSNGIIWVEGPSDAIYLQLFLELFKGSASELSKPSYCIQALSTAIWKYAGFAEFEWTGIDESLENRIIELSRLNHNHVIIIDRDDNYEDRSPSEHSEFKNGTGRNKARLINESMKFGGLSENNLENNCGDSTDGRLFFWINDGTMETYLEYFVNNKGLQFKKYFDIDNGRGYFEKLREGPNSSISKVELAAQIAQFCLQENVGISDIAPEGSALMGKIRRLFTTVKLWN